jgi:hypothetical protein
MPSWISAFRVIPWTEVLLAAPVVVKGARQLWDAARRETRTPAGAPMQDRVAALESQIERLREDLAESSGLVTSLAEQNARLVEAVAILRTRTQILFITGGALAAALVWLALAK